MRTPTPLAQTTRGLQMSRDARPHAYPTEGPATRDSPSAQLAAHASEQAMVRRWAILATAVTTALLAAVVLLGAFCGGGTTSVSSPAAITTIRACSIVPSPTTCNDDAVRSAGFAAGSACPLACPTQDEHCRDVPARLSAVSAAATLPTLRALLVGTEAGARHAQATAQQNRPTPSLLLLSISRT